MIKAKFHKRKQEYIRDLTSINDFAKDISKTLDKHRAFVICYASIKK